MTTKELSTPCYGIPHPSLYKQQSPPSIITPGLTTTLGAIFLVNHSMLQLPHLDPLYIILCHNLLMYHYILYHHVLVLLLLCVAPVLLFIYVPIISLAHNLHPFSAATFVMYEEPFPYLPLTTVVTIAFNPPLSHTRTLC